jgi:hypothetical protein
MRCIFSSSWLEEIWSDAGLFPMRSINAVAAQRMLRYAVSVSEDLRETFINADALFSQQIVLSSKLSLHHFLFGAH